MSGKIVRTGTAALAVLAVMFCAGSYAFDRHSLDQAYARYVPDAPSLLLSDADIAAGHPYSDVEFQLDGRTLRGHVYEPAGEARGLVVFRHGIYSQHQDYLAIITALADRGWKVFAYDAIGCGESDGDSTIGFAQAPLDVHAAVQFARASGMADGLPLLLVGHSWGAYGAAALDFDDGVAGCIALSGFDTSDGIILESLEGSVGPLAATQLPFIDLIGWMDFGEDAGRSASRAIDGSGLPVLVIHGAHDGTVRIDGASIMAARGSIRNPLVRYIVKDEPGRDGHNTYFYQEESWEYLAECQSALAALQGEYGGDVPADVMDAFMAGVDKERANTADPRLIDEMDSFLGECAATPGL